MFIIYRYMSNSRKRPTTVTSTCPTTWTCLERPPWHEEERGLETSCVLSLVGHRVSESRKSKFFSCFLFYFLLINFISGSFYTETPSANGVNTSSRRVRWRRVSSPSKFILFYSFLIYLLTWIIPLYHIMKFNILNLLKYVLNLLILLECFYLLTWIIPLITLSILIYLIMCWIFLLHLSPYISLSHHRF
jgi:hypothetical protein